jgi:transcription initiation factor TFIID subunit TAF12
LLIERIFRFSERSASPTECKNVRVLNQQCLKVRDTSFRGFSAIRLTVILMTQDILTHVTPGDVFDPAVVEFILDLADDFVDSVTSFSCKLALLRNSKVLLVKDVIAHLEQTWKIDFFGVGSGQGMVCGHLQ